MLNENTKEPKKFGCFELSHRFIKIRDDYLSKLSKYIYEVFGIQIPKTKNAMLKARLDSLLRKSNHQGYDNFMDDLFDNNIDAIRMLADKISTNHTFFFREIEHFNYFNESIKSREFLINKENNKLRIWSAGCSTGQEPYSIAMLIDDNKYSDFNQIDTKILATDISTSALKQALKAEYPENALEKVPEKFKQKYFINKGNGIYSVKNPLKENVLSGSKINCNWYFCAYHDFTIAFN